MKPKPQDAMEMRVRAVERVLDILIQLSAGEHNLTEVARGVGLSKATVLRLLAGMNYRYFVVRDANTGKYSLGPGAMLFMDRSLRSGANGHERVRRHMRYLAEATGETITLHMRVDEHRICIAEVESQQSLKYVSGIGKVEPVHTGAAGKVLLAALPPDQCEAVVRSLTLTQLTSATITDREELLRVLAEVRQRGYATSFGERIVGASCISVPVRQLLGVPVLTLSILGPTPRLPEEKLIEFLPIAQATAQQMEQGLPAPAVPAASSPLPVGTSGPWGS